MARLWQQADFNVFTAGRRDALDGQQDNSSDQTISDVLCNFCDLPVQWDLPPQSDHVCNVRVYCQNHNCQGRQGEYGICNPIWVPSSSGLTDAEIEAIFDDLLALGITWVRHDFLWSHIQPTATTWNWALYDRYVTIAAQKGLHLIALLAYSTTWSSGQTDRHPPATQDYVQFCQAVVARYAQQGIKHYEIWNEPNHTAFWKPLPNVAAYTTLLRAAYQAIKDVDSSCVVLSAGLAPAATVDGHISSQAFLQGMYDNGAKDNFDVVSFHPYTSPGMPPDGAWRQMGLSLPSLRSIMRSNGDGWKEIWPTEFGAPTGGPPGGDQVTEAQQATILASYINEMRKLPWAGPRFLYNYRDGPPAPDKERYFGLRRYDGTAKPGWTAVQTAIAQLVTD